jgi:hypothetical protein
MQAVRAIPYVAFVLLCVSSCSQPTMPSPFPLATVSLSTDSVIGGNPVACTVTLTDAAPAEGATLTITTTQPNVVDVPASVPIGPGATQTRFQVTTKLVPAPVPVTITAGYLGVTRSASLNVLPVR